MANLKYVFLGSSDAECSSIELEAYTNEQGFLYICIEDKEGGCPPQFTVLDRSTAIKLVKELKYQISLMQ
jgi:hypothetical protein